MHCLYNLLIWERKGEERKWHTKINCITLDTSSLILTVRSKRGAISLEVLACLREIFVGGPIIIILVGHVLHNWQQVIE